jgi:hypothetical protein
VWQSFIHVEAKAHKRIVADFNASVCSNADVFGKKFVQPPWKDWNVWIPRGLNGGLNALHGKKSATLTDRKALRDNVNPPGLSCGRPNNIFLPICANTAFQRTLNDSRVVLLVHKYFARIASACAFTYSQTTSTDHPDRSSAVVCPRSRATFRAILADRYAPFAFGFRAPRAQSWPRQKQPWTNKILQRAGNTESGLPGKFGDITA